jgi:protein O-mannosyl-transferase
VTRKHHHQKSLPLPWLLGILIAFGIVAYWNSFDVPFVFDDFLSIQRNPGVRFGEFNWSFLSARSVLYLTFTLNYIWAQQEVWTYHLVNLVFHLLNGILIFFVGVTIFQRAKYDEKAARIYALMAATFFLVHPIQTESVTYISSRSELLSTNFYLIGFLLFVKWPVARIGFLLSLVIGIPFFFGLGSKETVISLPATLLLYDFIFLSGATFRPVLQRWKFYAVYACGFPAAIYYILTVALKGSVGGNLAGHLSPGTYFLTQFRVVARYVGLVLYPVGLNLDYDIRPSQSLFEPAVFLSGLFLLAILVLGWVIRKNHSVFSFSIFWFFLTLAPTSGIVPILDVMFEHRLYLPLVGVCFSFPIVLNFLMGAAKRQWGTALRASSVAWILLCVLTVGTIMRNHIWRDEIRLYQDIVTKSPRKDRSYNGLTWAYFKKGQYDRAIATIDQALKVIPEKKLEFAETLGNLYLKTMRFDDAVNLFKQTLVHKDPKRLAVAYNNLGVAYLYKWQLLKSQSTQLPAGSVEKEKQIILSAASEAFAKCMEVDPTMFWAVDSFVNVSYDQGPVDSIESKALQELEKGAEFNNLYIVGKIAFLKGNFARADEFFERAEKLRDNEKLIYFNHGYALDQLNQDDRAIEKYLQALRVDPVFIEAHHNVALIYKERRDYKSAIEHLSEVLRFDPKHVNTNLNLAQIYAAEGNKPLARNYLNNVLSSSPGNQQALQVWQQLGL